MEVKEPNNSSSIQSLRVEQAVLSIAMAVALTLGFYITDQYMAAQCAKGKYLWSPALPWDSIIPFSPAWVWIYMLYFPVCFLPVLFREVRQDRAVFRRTALGFAIQFIIALSIFWIFPSRMHRPLFQPNGFNEQALFWFYKIDPGFNIFPSLHVANASYVALLIWKLKGGFASILIWTLCALIAASTLFVKQHYIVDVPSGVLVGVLGYCAAFSIRRRS